MFTPTIIASPWAEKILDSLSLDQKIGQLFMVAATAHPEKMDEDTPYHIDQPYIDYLISTYHIGGIIFLPSATSDEFVAFTQHFQHLSKIPLLIALDFEWGIRELRLTDIMRFPTALCLGAIQDNQLIYEFGKEIGRQCRILGIHMNLAPVVDINTNPNNPIIHMRSFGENSEHVTQKSISYMRGLRDSGIIACAKHFPGHGDTAVDSHLDLPLLTHNLQRLHAVELVPFKKMIAEKVPAIMVAHLAIPALDPTPNLPASLSKPIVSTLLKKELGFEGLVITDGLGMQGVLKHHQPGELELKALLAGNDILLCPIDVPKAVELIKQAIANGDLSEKKLDEHVYKILCAKEWSFNQPPAEPFAQPHLHQLSAYQLKKQLYEKALTLAINNDKQRLPLPPQQPTPTVIVVGSPQQQTFTTTLAQHTPLTMHAIDAHADEKTLLTLVNQLNRKSTVILAIFPSNNRPSDCYGITPSMQKFLQQLKEQQVNLITVFFGSPYGLAYLQDSHAIILTYEDDPDAQAAAAQAIVGKLNPQGKLPVSAGSAFPEGWGLSYE